jgi:hypothetical protein
VSVRIDTLLTYRTSRASTKDGIESADVAKYNVHVPKDSECGVSLNVLTALVHQLKKENFTTGQAAGASIDPFFQARLAEPK